MYIRTEKGVEKMTDEQYQKYVSLGMVEKTYVELRQGEYGSVVNQLEFITENGIEAWQKKVAEIKGQFPKPE